MLINDLPSPQRVWLTACDSAVALAHGNARRNLEQTAIVRASLSCVVEGKLFSHETLGRLASDSPLNNDQVRLGTKRLKELGLLIETQERGSNTPPVYRMAIPDNLLWRLHWKHEPVERKHYNLNQGQSDLADVISDFIVLGAKPEGSVWSDHVFVIHGYAGTGKTTTVVQAVMSVLEPDEVCFMAPSNKAAAVLRGQGVSASTIHRELYQIRGNDPTTKEPIFEPDLFNDLRKYEVVVVDEASMVPEHMARWIESEAKRVIVIGDPLQLPPVKGVPLWTAADYAPDYELTEVVRTDNPDIAMASQRFREDDSMTLDSLRGSPVYVPQGASVALSDYDVVMTYTNKDRATINAMVRGVGPPKCGDKVMVLETVTDTPDMSGPDDYFNGQSLTVTRLIATVRDGRKGVGLFHIVECVDDRRRTRRTHILDDFLMAHDTNFIHNDDGSLVPRKRGIRREGIPILTATYGHAVTAHKAQGSSWGKVLVINPGSGSDGLDLRKFGYTAITRAELELTIASMDQVQA